MNALLFEAAKYAWSRMPQAAKLVGDATADEIATWCDNANRLAELRGVAEPYTELAGELIALGEKQELARVVALWAALRFFGADPRVTSELDGPTDDELERQRLAFEADREEAETRRFYREEFPAIAAARGQAVEESPAWQRYVAAFAAKGGQIIESPRGMGKVPEVVEGRDFSLQVDWSADRIREEYRRWWTTAERRFWAAEYAAAKPHAADELEAARFATRRVLDRRIAAGSRPFSPETTAAAGAGA